MKVIFSSLMLLYNFHRSLLVCLKFFDKFINSLDDAEKNNKEAIEHRFKETCKKAKGKDERLVGSVFYQYSILP